MTTGTTMDPIAAFFHEPVALLTDHTSQVAAALTGIESMTAAELDSLIEPHAFMMMNAASVPLHGAGFIVSPTLLVDAGSHLAWWQGRVTKRRLVLEDRGVEKQSFDYRERDWYRVPFATKTMHITGPYVDYLCSDEYTLTITALVEVSGQPVGVLGVDLLLEDVEREVAPLLGLRHEIETIVNHDGRVIVSSHPDHAAGDVLRPAALERYDARECVPGLPMRILTPA